MARHHAWLLAFALSLPGVPAAAQSLDYDFFKRRVEPIFLEQRAGHARCYSCHSQSNNAFHLERLAAGAKFWTEEQSRKNFEMIQRVVNPGAPAESPLLLHPLDPKAGGDPFHSGGRQFASRSDKDWRILAQFAGVKPAAAAKTIKQ
jgi:hypothetical protein